MDPVIYLEALINRLEPEFGLARKEYCGYWARDTAAAQRVNDRAASGVAHLGEAVREARAALASGDAERIAQIAPHCLALERTGNDMRKRYLRQERAKTAQRNGGRKRGEEQTKKADDDWRSYVNEYTQLLARDVPYRTARRMIAAKRVKDEKPASAKTLAKHLPKPQ